MLRWRGRPARLPGRRRAGHGDGVHPSLRRRAVGLRHGPGRPGGDARAGGGTAARGGCDGGAGGAGRSAGQRGRRGAGQAGRRSRAHRHGAQPASALCRHRGDADRRSDHAGSDRCRFHRGASRALRLRHAGPPAGGGGGGGRSDFSGRRGAGGDAGRARDGRADADRSGQHLLRWGGARRAGVRPHRAAGGRPHRRPGADPRGERDHGGGARLDGGDHAAGSHDAAPHLAAALAGVGRDGPTRCCWSCSTTCS